MNFVDFHTQVTLGHFLQIIYSHLSKRLVFYSVDRATCMCFTQTCFSDEFENTGNNQDAVPSGIPEIQEKTT